MGRAGPGRKLRVLAALALTLTPTLGVGAQTVDDVSRVVAEVEPEVQRMLIEGRIPSAAIALVVGDQIIWQGAYGQSNLWSRTPAVPSTVYLIGSTFKAQSTVALLQQMERGKFKLDDRVNDYLHEFKIRGEDLQHPVTFRHLLTHTSGLPGDFGPYSVWGDSVPEPLVQYLSRALKVMAAPRDTLVYSNLAFTLVGYLVEKFSGIPYKQYIRDSIWTPLEMTSTAFDPTPEMDERLAVPYVPDREGRNAPTVRLKAQVWPAGIVYGTVHDQADWLILNLNRGVFKGRRLVKAETMDTMHTLQFDPTGPMAGGWGYERTGYGLVWWLTEKDGEHYIAHSGSVPGFTAFVAGNLDRKVGVAVLTNGNRAHPHLVKLVNRVLEILAAHEIHPEARRGGGSRP